MASTPAVDLIQGEHGTDYMVSLCARFVRLYSFRTRRLVMLLLDEANGTWWTKEAEPDRILEAFGPERD